ncbi:ankyrin [Byssothecium circinans]|uniref:Ankyrin n=1 Tax=Byssothecium circinans TaxID=147558 RepID=A0A6A5T880_9PLEO|nr:ankyrin [Byssothecium circinans]
MAAPTTKPQTAKHSILNPEKPKFGFGLEQVWPIDDGSSKAPSKHSVDIIAIPGLGATSEYTWKCRDPDNPDKKIDWLRDSNMLPGILPKARICIFKYDSQWFGVGAVDQRLDSVADKLLHTLEKFRGADNKTPIVFVAHCLGGIVLEQLLLTAQGQQHRFPSIFPRVAGCVFLGTPFRGTASQAKAMALARMAELAGMGLQSSLLKILERESPTLLELCDKFIALADDAKIRLFCFWELRQSDVASIFVKDPWFKKLDMFKQMELMVEPGSAKPSGARGTYLDSDHFQLNKYPGPKDDNFKSVSGELKDIAKQAPNILNSRRKLARKARVDDRVHGALINYFEEGFFDVRRTMKGSYEGSQSPESSWVVTGSVFQQWKEAEGPQLLWIHGEAGTGQRAIALSIRDDLSKPGEQRPIFASFFCDENDEFRRSFRGMLKILIRQIIDADPDMAEPLVPHVKIKTSNESAKENYDLDALDKIHVLWDALQAMGRTAPGGYIHLMVYGIEQLAPEPLRNLLQYMQDTLTHGGDAVETSPIKWILLSRSGHPEIKKSLGGHGHEIYLNDKANTKSVEDDLRAHISRRVKELGLTPSLGYFVKGYISSHAGGNRIYVDLAIQEIRNSQAERSLQQAEMRLLLGSFPYGLTNMFEHIRKRILSPTTEGIEYTREILRCLILQKRAPTMRELAIMADLPHQDRNNLRALKNYIIRCGAFVVLRGKDGDLNDDHMKVEWIDRLAQEHLEKCAKDELAMDSVEMQHGLIALRCLEYVYFHTEKYGAASSADQTSLDVDDMDSTGEAGDEQEKENEDLSDPSNEVSNFSQLPFATEDNDATPSIHFDVGSPDEEDAQMFDERDPLTYPMKCWLEHAKSARGAPINVIEEIDLSHEFWQVQSSLRQIWWDRIEWMGHFDHQDGVTALHVAAIAEVPELVEYLLQEGGKQGGCPDIHVEDSWGLQPLHVACYIGNYEIVQALLGAGADVNYVSTNDDDDGLWRDCPLHLAAGEGHVHILECLLDRGAEINMESERDGSVL